MISNEVKTKIKMFSIVSINILFLSILPTQPAQALTIESAKISNTSNTSKISKNDPAKDNTSAEKALMAINSGKENFSDFAAAGVKRQVKGNKADYESAIASAINVKGTSLTLSEVQKAVDSVNETVAATALSAINSGSETFEDFAVAGVINTLKANKAAYDSAIADALKTKMSKLTLSEVQNTVNNVNTSIVLTALTAINSGTELYEDFAKAGITKVTKANKLKYDTAIADARKIKGLDLNLIEVQNTVNSVNETVIATALTAINSGIEDISDFAAAGVWKAVKANKEGYDSAIADARRNKGSDLTASELQKTVEKVNAAAATTALTIINSGTEEFSDFAAAGITKTYKANKAGYDSAIAADRLKKGSDLTLAEMQEAIERVNAAVAADALKALNGGTEKFTDFVTAGVKKAEKGNLLEYDSAIATAIKLKGAGLTLAELQETVDKVNAVAAADALWAIDQGTEDFSDFAAAGITKAVQTNKARYDSAIAKAREESCSMLALADVQNVVEAVNHTAPSSALLAINAETEIFADFAVAGITGAIAKNKAQYDTAIQAARTPNGPSLTLVEVQKQVDLVNAAAVEIALKSLNKGTKDFSDYSMAGVKGAIGGLKRYYDAAIETGINQKGSNLTLEEVQTVVDKVNSLAGTSLAAINDGTEGYYDFTLAGVTNVLPADKAKYDSAIAAALKDKGSDLTLAEIQKVVDSVNVPLRLQLINAGTEQFSDFTLAGVKGAVGRYKNNYDKVIATAKKAKGSDLLLEEIQKLVDDVNNSLSVGKTNK